MKLLKLFWLYLYERRHKIGFWLVWIPLCPLVYGFYLWSELSRRRTYYSMAWTKTGLVKQSVWDNLVLHKNRNHLDWQDPRYVDPRKKK